MRLKLLGLAKGWPGWPKGYNIIGILLIKHYIMAAFFQMKYTTYVHYSLGSLLYSV